MWYTKADYRQPMFRRALLAAAVASAPVAMAQSPERAASEEKSSGAVLDEIVVTAQGRVQSLVDVPVAVSVVDGEQLENFSITGVEDMAQRMPNVDIRSGPADGLSIRGVGSGNNAGFQQSVGVYVDGVYRSRSRSIHSALFDIDRVEVLKGPQTTFFGANSIAGALNITTRKPGRSLDWNFSTLYGSHGEYNLEGGVDLPLADNFHVRLAGKVSGMDGYISTREGDAPEKDNQQLRVSFDWLPTDSWQSEFRFDYGDSESVGALPFQLVDCPVPEGYASGTACSLYQLNNDGNIDDELDYNSDAALDFINFEHKEAVWTNTFDIGDTSTLMLKTAYYDHESDALFTGIPFVYEHDPASGLPPFNTALPGVRDPFPLSFYEEFDQLSQEVRFQTDTGGFLDVMVGAYYDEQDFFFQNQPGFFFNDFGAIVESLNMPGVSVEAGDFITAVGDYSAENETYSAFAALTLRPTDRTTVNIGGRYTRFDKQATRSSTRGLTDPTLSSYEVFNPADDAAVNLILGGNRDDFSPNSRTDKDFMPSVSVQHDIADNMMAYGSYSEGFKAGGFATGNNPDIFGPEYVDAYEVGMKGAFFDHRLALNLAVFLNQYEDFQETVQVNQGVTLVSVIRNAGKLEAKGVELDGTLEVSHNLSFRASVAYLESIYDEFPNAACTGRQIIEAGGSQQPCAQDLSGKTRGYAPEWSGNISADWTVPLDNYNLTVSPMLFFTDEYYMTATADPWQMQSGYTKLDLRAALSPADEKWTLSLIGKNLTDKITANSSEAVTNSDGSARQIVARPRSVALQFSMRY